MSTCSKCEDTMLVLDGLCLGCCRDERRYRNELVPEQFSYSCPTPSRNSPRPFPDFRGDRSELETADPEDDYYDNDDGQGVTLMRDTHEIGWKKRSGEFTVVPSDWLHIYHVIRRLERGTIYDCRSSWPLPSDGIPDVSAETPSSYLHARWCGFAISAPWGEYQVNTMIEVPGPGDDSTRLGPPSFAEVGDAATWMVQQAVRRSGRNDTSPKSLAGKLTRLTLQVAIWPAVLADRRTLGRPSKDG